MTRAQLVALAPCTESNGLALFDKLAPTGTYETHSPVVLDDDSKRLDNSSLGWLSPVVPTKLGSGYGDGSGYGSGSGSGDGSGDGSLQSWPSAGATVSS